ncbi:MAG: hypothetical protein AAF467_21990 [Actinomycetota bacterium]
MMDVKVSQELMGHEDIRLTRGLYADADDQLKRDANDAIVEDILVPACDRSAMNGETEVGNDG